MTRLDARTLIERLGLTPLGFEGGYYRETYRSALEIESSAVSETHAPGPRQLGSAIFYLLTPESRSLMHRLETDEVYHFYLGDPVDLFLIHPDGRDETVRLGSSLLEGETVQQVVPARTWQGSSLVPGGRFALMGTTMAPGFDLADFELGRRRDLLDAYPHLAARLRELTPEVLESERLELAAATRDLLHAELRGPDALLAGLSARAPAGAWPPEGANDAQSRLARLEADRGRRGWRSWYVVERRNRALVGLAGYEGPPDPDGVVKVWASMTEPARGRGLATEAAGALVERALETAQVRRVRAEAPPASAAERVLAKLGFAVVQAPPEREGARVFERPAS